MWDTSTSKIPRRADHGRGTEQDVSNEEAVWEDKHRAREGRLAGYFNHRVRTWVDLCNWVHNCGICSFLPPALVLSEYGSGGPLDFSTGRDMHVIKQGVAASVMMRA